MRSRVAAGLAVLLLSLSCSENPGSALTPVTTSARLSELETVEGLIVALLPNGLQTAGLKRWEATLAALGRGSEVAQRHMMQLADFVLKHEANGRLDDPDGAGPMTVNEGVLRLISLMFGVVNPGAPTPPTNLAGDFVVAVVDGSHQTVVTPTHFAGVEFPAGAAAEPFLLVIRDTPDVYDNCGGPLDTQLCQYPRFYDFTPFPATRLTRRAVFGVCVVVEGGKKPSKEIDDRLRLAHDAPADAPRPGYEFVPGRKNGIEILPYVQTRFLDCHRKPSKLIDVIGSLLLPKKAYAIDLGGGGMSDAFSNFNVVDPGSREELPRDR